MYCTYAYTICMYECIMCMYSRALWLEAWRKAKETVRVMEPVSEHSSYIFMARQHRDIMVKQMMFL